MSFSGGRPRPEKSASKREPFDYQLKFNTVDIWQLNCIRSPQPIKQLERLLNSSERKKARRFRFARDRDNYIIRHGYQRFLLGKYLCLQPERIEFLYSRKGKPFLNPPRNQKSLYFSMSYSNDLVLFGLTLSPCVGIDVEYIQPDQSIDHLAEEFLHPDERSEIDQLTNLQKQAYFYTLWTCKEAYLKATGEGLSGLSKIRVIPIEGDRFGLYRGGKVRRRLNDWALQFIELGPGYAGALAIKGQQPNLRSFNLDHQFHQNPL